MPAFLALAALVVQAAALAATAEVEAAAPAKLPKLIRRESLQAVHQHHEDAARRGPIVAVPTDSLQQEEEDDAAEGERGAEDEAGEHVEKEADDSEPAEEEPSDDGQWSDEDDGVAAAIEKAVREASQLHAARNAGQRGQHGGVLFLVYSGSQFYGTRLKWIMETWGKELPKSALVVIGDGPGNIEGLTVHTTACPSHSHWEGACCKYAEAVMLANQIMLADPTFKWAYFADDDAYVRPNAMGRALLQQPSAPGHGVVLGVFGCAAQTCKGGLCAGGGYAADGRALTEMVGQSAASFLQQQMRDCATCGRWADVALSRTMIRVGLERRGFRGVNGWKLSRTCFARSLAKDAAYEPLMYHYIQSESQMKFLDAIFEGAKKSPGADSSSPACVDFKGSVQCAASLKAEDVPWNPDLDNSAHCFGEDRSYLEMYFPELVHTFFPGS